MRWITIAVWAMLSALASASAQAQKFTGTGPETQRMLPQLQSQYRGEFATRTENFGPDGKTPKYLNRLILEASPYLRQHAHNPVDWRPWNEETLAYARRVNKPIFLSIGYATCHWCHVMEHESFDSEPMASLINDLFVPVKVDREQNPDVDLLYMTALQLSSETAGWPLTGFLMPNAKPFFVDSYMPPVLLDNVIGQVRNYWNTDQAALAAFSEDLSGSVQGYMTAQRDAATLTRKDSDRALVFFIATTDPRHGGYGRAPKFPREPELMWALDVLEQHPNDDLERSLTLSLDGMMAGGIHDQIGGGFHRYAVDNIWEIPHFEKMLYNQAQLLQVYARAAALLDRPDYRRVAERIAAFVLRDMTSPDGLFMSGYDADSEGEEGPFYIWTEAEIDRVLSREEAAWAKLALEIDDNWANFEGKSLPTGRKQIPWRDDILAKLEAARRDREWPLLDNKRITAWNAQMAEAFAIAGRVLERPDFQTVALQSAERLWNLQMRNGVQRFSNDGRVSPTPGVLQDYAYTIKAFVRLYDQTGDKRWLNRSQQLAETMQQRFWDADLGLFTEADQAQNTLFVTPVSTNDAGQPSGAATAVLALTELGRRAGNPRMEQLAAQALAGISGRASVSPTAHGSVWRAVLRRMEPGHANDGTAVTAAGTVRAWIEGNSLVMAIEPGWHINSFTPRQNDLVGTLVRFDGQGQSAITSAPSPRLTTLRFSPEPLETYEGFLRLPLEGQGNHLLVDVQACDDRRCLPPETLRLPLSR